MMQILGFENFTATFLKTLLGLGMGGMEVEWPFCVGGSYAAVCKKISFSFTNRSF